MAAHFLEKPWRDYCGDSKFWEQQIAPALENAVNGIVSRKMNAMVTNQTSFESAFYSWSVIALIYDADWTKTFLCYLPHNFETAYSTS